jgi:hypothetical protein
MSPEIFTNFYQVSAFLSVTTEFFLADAAAIKVGLMGCPCATTVNPMEKAVTTSRYQFPKPINKYVVLLIFGSNIVASEGDEWKKTRKIVAPAFSDVRRLFPCKFRCCRSHMLPAQ